MAKKGISIDEAKKQMHEKVLKAMKESVMMVQSDAQLNVGVDTGHLRRNITHDVRDEGDKIIGEVGTGVNISAPCYGDIV